MADTPFIDSLRKSGIASEPVEEKPAAPARSFAADMRAAGLLPQIQTPVTPVTPPARTLAGTAKDIGLDLTKGLISVPEAVVGLADIPTGGYVGKAFENIGFRPAEAKQTLEQYYSPARQAAGQKVSDAEGVGGKLKAAVQNPSVVASAAIESAPLILGGGVVARGLGKVAPALTATKRGQALLGSVGEGVMGAGSAAEGIRQESVDGGLTLKQSGLAALSGLGTTAFGYGGNRLAQKLGIADVDLIAAGYTATGSKNLVRRVLEGAASEGLLEELPQSIQEQVLQNAALERDLSTGVDEAAVLGALAGGLMGGTVAGVARGQKASQGVDPKEFRKRIEDVARFRAENPGVTLSDAEVQAYLGGAPTPQGGEVKSAETQDIPAPMLANEQPLAEAESPAQEPPKPLSAVEPSSSNQGVTSSEPLKKLTPEVARVAARIAGGATEFTPEELQVQANFPREVEARLQTLKALDDRNKAIQNKTFGALEKLRLETKAREIAARQTEGTATKQDEVWAKRNPEVVESVKAEEPPAEPTKLYRGEYPFKEGDPVGESKGVASGAFWTTDRGTAEYFAKDNGTFTGGYVREAVLAPEAKALTLFDAEGNEDAAGVQEWERITGEAFDAQRVIEKGLGRHTEKFKAEGYDVVHSMDIDGQETLVLNPKVLVESKGGSQDAVSVRQDSVQGQTEVSDVRAVPQGDEGGEVTPARAVTEPVEVINQPSSKTPEPSQVVTPKAPTPKGERSVFTVDVPGYAGVVFAEDRRTITRGKKKGEVETTLHMRKKDGTYEQLTGNEKRQGILDRISRAARVSADVKFSEDVTLYRGDSASLLGLSQGTGDLGKGSYLTDDPAVAEYFTDGTDRAHVKAYKARLKNPFDLMARDIADNPSWQSMMATVPEGMNKTLLERWAKNDLDVKNTYGFLARSFGQTPETFNTFLQQHGFDGIRSQGVRGLSDGSHEYVVFDSAQVQLQDLESLRSYIEAEIGLTLSEDTFTEVAAPNAELYTELSRILKKRIVFFSAKNSPVAFNAVTGIVEDTLFINASAKKPHLALVGHEFLHDLKRESPEDYAALRDAVMKVIPESERQARWGYLNEKRAREGRAAITLSSVDEELVADFFGDQFLSKEFWVKVERKNPDGFAGIVQRLLDFIDRIKAAFTGKQREDIDKAQEIAAEALARYVRKNPLEGGVPQFSETLGAFYSRLEQAVQAKMGGKMTSDALRNMLKNNGVTDDEIGQVLPGLDVQKVMSKQEVLDEIRANAVELEDVVLGGGDLAAVEEKIESTRIKYVEAQENLRRLNTFLAGKYGAFTLESLPAEDKVSWNETIARRDDLAEELDAARDEKKRLEGEPQFSSYQEPGAVEGGYREMFVTAPKQAPDFGIRYEAQENGTVKAFNREGTPMGTFATEAGAKEYFASAEGRGWEDGHSQYDQIQNPIVRLRFNERQGPKGERILFIEEIQGPSDANQSKMPEYLRKRIYDLGVKRALAYAKANGFDGIAWTTGEMQANRYDLSKQVDELFYRKLANGKIEIDAVQDGQHKAAYKVDSEADLEGVVGKEIAKKIMDNEGEVSKNGKRVWGKLSGLDLKVGGEGLKDTYDVRLPSLFKKYGKEGVGKTKINTYQQSKPDSLGVVGPTKNGVWALVDKSTKPFATTLAEFDSRDAAWDALEDRRGTQVPFLPITDKTPASYAKFSEDLTPRVKANIAASVEALRSGSVKTEALETVLKFTPESVVVEVWGKDMPQLPELYQLRRKREAVRNDLADNAGLLFQEIESLAKKGVGKEAVENVAAVSTFHQMWPDRQMIEQDWVPAFGTTESRLKGAQTVWEKAGMQTSTGLSFQEAYHKSREAFDALKDENLQEAYLKAVESMGRLRQREKNALQRTIEQATADNPELREELLAQLEQSFSSLKGAYWPLYREGEYILAYMQADTRVVEHFDTDFERSQAMSLLQQGGVDPASFEVRKMRNAPPVMTTVQQKFMLEITEAVEAQYTQGLSDPDAIAQAKQRANEVTQEMMQIWLRWQPETSALKNSIQRKNVRGWSTHMLRGFLRYTQAHAQRIAQLEEGRKIEAILDSMADDLTARSKAGEDTTRLDTVLKDLLEREAAGRTISVNKFAQTLGRWTTFWYMTSPSIALVQMTQLGVLTLPKLSVMYSPAKAAAALTRGIQSAFSPKFTREAMFDNLEVSAIFDDIQAVVTPENRLQGQVLGAPRYTNAELKQKIALLSPEQQRFLALRVAMSQGLLDISLSHEVGEIVRGGDPTQPLSKVHKGMMSFMRLSETASRKAAILATFDAATADGKDFFGAMKSVDEVVESTLYNYSKDAKGVLLQGSTARVLLTFQHFRIMTAFKIGMLFKNTFAGESAEVKNAAGKELVGIFGMSGLLAGAMGMPFAPILFKILDMIRGDDDEPVDSEAEFKKWLQVNFGETTGDLVAEGPASLLGAALSRRIGLGDVVGSGTETPAYLHGEGALAWWATQMLGPSYAMVAGWARGYDQMVNEGEVMKGLEAASPKPLKDALKAYGMAASGVKTGRGKTLLTADQVGADEIAMMALGFQPLEASKAREEQRSIDTMSTNISTRRGQLVQDLVKAELAGEDSSEQIEAISRFNEKMPAFAIRGSDLRQALKTQMKLDAGLDSRRERLIKGELR